MRLLSAEAESPSELENDLNSEVCSTKLEAEPSEEIRDLNREVYPTKLEATPSDPDNVLARPLVSELAKVSEIERDLYDEVCSAKLEAKPSAVVIDLNSDDFSTKPDGRDNEPL